MQARTLDIVFGALMIATFITWFIGERGGHGPLIAAAVLGLALVKGWLVADDFMGLRHTAMHWRLIVLLWLVLVCVAIGIAYYFGMR